MPTKAVPLFRPAAVDAQRPKLLGNIILIHPLPFRFLTAFAVALAGLVVAFLVWGTYTKRSTVVGHLVPNSGLIQVHVQQPGIVLEKRVAEGQPVRQGDVLYVVSSERTSSTQGDIQATISRQVGERQRSLRAELGSTRRMQSEEQRTLTRKIAALQAELSNVDGQIKGQRERVLLVEDALNSYRDLAGRGFVSKETLQQKQGEALDQQALLQSLERNHISVEGELRAHQDELNGLPLKHDNQLALIERNITSADQELTESEARRQLVVTAPASGTATAVVAEVGQVVDVDRPLAAIVPAGAILQAHLYAPSKAVGFVKPGDAVLLRYLAYPYQKFGHHRGIVATVSRTALPSNQLTYAGMGSSGRGGSASEPMYLVTVDLASQSVPAYGKPQPLQSGMLLEADVLQDTRRLYEWVLEPLYSLSGRFAQSSGVDEVERRGRPAKPTDPSPIAPVRTPSPPVPTKGYRVQVLATPIQDSAEAMAAPLRQAGYQALIVREGRLFKVRSQAFATRSEAQMALTRIQAQLGGEPFIVRGK